MIKSFKCKETEKLFGGRFSAKLPRGVQKRAAFKLNILHAATQLDTLRVPPSNHLEAMKGNRAGQYSIRVNDQWRICFIWRHGHAFDVEIVDYR